MAGKTRYGVPAAIRQSLCAVTDHLAAFQQMGDKTMFLELLQDSLRIKARVGIFQAGYITQRNQIVFGAIHPGATKLLGGERPSQREDHLAFADAPRGHLPQFLHAYAISLWIAVFVQIEA